MCMPTNTLILNDFRSFLTQNYYYILSLRLYFLFSIAIKKSYMLAIHYTKGPLQYVVLIVSARFHVLGTYEHKLKRTSIYYEEICMNTCNNKSNFFYMFPSFYSLMVPFFRAYQFAD